MTSTDSSASSIRSVVTSTGAPSKHPSQLLLAPSFLICAGAILFRGIPSHDPSTSTWTPPSPPSLSSSSAETSPSPSFQPLNGDVNVSTSTSRRGLGQQQRSSSSLEVCIIYHERKKEYLLPKGRKDQFETGLMETALRETHEETGYPCRPLPVAMRTRAPLPRADIKVSLILSFYLPYSVK